MIDWWRNEEEIEWARKGGKQELVQPDRSYGTELYLNFLVT